MKILLIFLTFYSFTLASTNINNLISKLKKESELSKLTKQDTAGIITIFTREDIEKINAVTLKDILKTIPLVNLSRNIRGEYVILSPGAGFLPSSNVRIYINNHELNSNYHAGALSLWANMSLEFIDHIEVYRGTSTIEFGNIPGVLVIRLYSKSASREDGGKIKLTSNKFKDAKIDTYYGYNLKDDKSIFVYANKGRFENRMYNFNNKIQSSNVKNNTAYVNAQFNDIGIEIAQYNTKSGAFLISGQNNNIQDNTHKYINVNKEFRSQNIKLHMSYDNISYSKKLSESSFYAGDLGVITKVDAFSHDDDFMISLEKNLKLKLNDLLIGTFYKKKEFEIKGYFGDTYENYENSVSVSSIYIQDKNKLSDNSILVASFKNDHYSYGKDLKSNSQITAKLGFITKHDKLVYKMFYTKTYQDILMYQKYTQNNIPYKSNPDLKNPKMDIYSAYLEYKFSKSLLSFEYFRNEIKDAIYSKLPPIGDGVFRNNPKEAILNWYVIKDEYYFDDNNKILLSFYQGNNSKNFNYSPKKGMKLLLFNKYRKFDIYNEVLYTSKYELENIKVEDSFTYSMNIKYNYSKDTNMFIRGENLLNKGYKQAYKNIPEPLSVHDRKTYIGMEYLF